MKIWPLMVLVLIFSAQANAQLLDESIAKAFENCDRRMLFEHCSHHEFVVGKTPDGKTPLHHAAEWGCQDLMEEMHHVHAVPVDGKTPEHRRTALHLAVKFDEHTAEGKAKCVEVLLDMGAKTDVMDENMETQILYFFKENKAKENEDVYKKIFISLYDADADVTVKDKNGHGLLYYLYENNKSFDGIKGIYIKLFQKGLDPSKEQYDGEPLIQYAQYKPKKAQNKALLEAWATYSKAKK